MPDCKYKLIALDLDGTLLDSNKNLSERNYRALERAAQEGVEVVPTTGRLVDAMPKVIRELPFVRYVISVNGAQVVDLQTGETLYRAEIPYGRVLEVMESLDSLPVIYDCYLDGRGWMTQSMYDRAEEFAPDEHILDLIRRIRTPVPELKAFVREKAKPVQKMQMFFHSKNERVAAAPELIRELSDLTLTSSYENNIEINHPDACKGAALDFLCTYLGFSSAQAMSFGDGSNDISMLIAAGMGVAMANADNEVKQVSDYITDSCDDDGVAAAIEKLILNI